MIGVPSSCARPRVWRRRAAAAVVAVGMTGGFLASTGTAGAAPATPPVGPPTPGSVAAQVRQMQATVDRVGAELAQRATAYEQGSARLDELLQRQFAAERRVEGREEDTKQAQARLNAVARRAYTRPVPESWTLAMSIDPADLTQSLENIMVLRRLGVTQRGAVESFTRETVDTAAEAARLEDLRQQAQVEQQALDAQLSEIRAKSADALAQLQAAQARLAELRAQQQARAARAASARAALAAARAAAARNRFLGPVVGTCSAPADGAYANGFLPAEVLCPLATAPGQQLVAAAAAAFDRMSLAHQAATGRLLCVTDSYRSYAEQVDVFARKPSLAATPGRSQHGLGLAVDMCGGVERFDTADHLWMQNNAPQFGFIHPAWAESGGSKPEAWHWEYVG